MAVSSSNSSWFTAGSCSKELCFEWGEVTDTADSGRLAIQPSSFASCLGMLASQAAQEYS